MPPQKAQVVRSVSERPSLAEQIRLKAKAIGLRAMAEGLKAKMPARGARSVEPFRPPRQRGRNETPSGYCPFGAEVE